MIVQTAAGKAPPPRINKSHPGQERGSARKKRRRAEREAAAQEAGAN